MKFFKSDLDWLDVRAQKDFQDVFNLTNQGQDFAIISIDMQKKYLDWIEPISKKKILIEYHKRIKKISNQNNIPFIEIEYRGQDINVLRDKDSIHFIKDTDSVAFNLDLMKYLIKNKIKNLYVIGINRNNCVLSSIYYLKDKGYNIFTSILGTGSSAQDYNLYKDKRKTNEFLNAYSQIYKQNNIELYKLKNNINLLIKIGVVILDYYRNDNLKNNKITKEVV